jgi:hypothetical protein
VRVMMMLCGFGFSRRDDNEMRLNLKRHSGKCLTGIGLL